jgi:hypothetical protein
LQGARRAYSTKTPSPSNSLAILTWARIDPPLVAARRVPFPLRPDSREPGPATAACDLRPRPQAYHAQARRARVLDRSVERPGRLAGRGGAGTGGRPDLASRSHALDFRDGRPGVHARHASRCDPRPARRSCGPGRAPTAFPACFGVQGHPRRCRDPRPCCGRVPGRAGPHPRCDPPRVSRTRAPGLPRDRDALARRARQTECLAAGSLGNSLTLRRASGADATNARNPSRCQRTIVSGLTKSSAARSAVFTRVTRAVTRNRTRAQRMPNTAPSDLRRAGSSSLVDHESLNGHAEEEQVAATALACSWSSATVIGWHLVVSRSSDAARRGFREYGGRDSDS